MVKSIFIKLNYGPYAAHGIMKHRKQRLYGLIDHLQKENYLVVLHPVPHINRLTIEILDREIFRCDIRNLLFNIPSYDDPVCMRIINVIKDTESYFCSETNYEKYVSINEGMRWFEKIRQGFVPTGGSKDFDIRAPANSLLSKPSNTSTELFDNEEILVTKLSVAEKRIHRDSRIVELSKQIVDQIFRDLQEAMMKRQEVVKSEPFSSSSGANSVDEPILCPCPPPSENRSTEELAAFPGLPYDLDYTKTDEIQTTYILKSSTRSTSTEEINTITSFSFNIDP